MTHKNKLRNWLGILTGIVLMGYFIYAQFAAPAPFYNNYDPEMAYFMSSLSFLGGHPIVYTDHPGTPVEMLGALILAATGLYTWVTRADFFFFHLSHPEVFLSLARGVLASASAACSFWLVKYAVKGDHWSDVFASFCVAISFYAFHPNSFDTLNLWSHNSFNFPFGSLYLLGLLILVRSGRLFEKKWLVLLGLGAGVLTASQLYFLTWAVGGLAVILFTGILQRMRFLSLAHWASLYLGAVLAGFGVSLLPITQQLPRFWNWVSGLIFHQGRYGIGAEGVISGSAFLQSLSGLWAGLPGIFIVLASLTGLLVFMFFWQRRKQAGTSPNWGLAAGLLAQAFVTLLIIIKHPGGIYLLSLAAIYPLLIAAIFLLAGTGSRFSAVVRVGIGAAILILFAWNLAQSAVRHELLSRGLWNENRALQEKIAQVGLDLHSSGQRPIVLWTYGSYSPCYALWFGNDYADAAQTGAIAKVCPHQYSYNLWNKMIVTPDGILELGDDRWDLLISREELVLSYDPLKDYSYQKELDAAIHNYGPYVFIFPAGHSSP